MLQVHLLCSALCLAAGQAGAALDRVALVQKELRISQAPGRTRIIAKTVVQKAIAKLDQHVDDYIAQHTADLNVTRRLKENTEKYMAQDRSSSGALDEANEELAIMVLGWLQDERFFKAARLGLLNLTRSLSMIPLRSEKRVSDLVLASESRPMKEFPEHLSGFFMKEAHIISSTVEVAADLFMTILSTAPGYEGVVGDAVQPLVEHLKNYTATRVNMLLQTYAATNGSDICKYPLVGLRQEFLPALAEVEGQTSLVKAFVQAKAPVVLPQASELLDKLGKTATSLAAKLQTDVRLGVEKVCKLIGQPVALVPAPAPEAAAALTVQAAQPMPTTAAPAAEATPEPIADSDMS